MFKEIFTIAAMYLVSVFLGSEDDSEYDQGAGNADDETPDDETPDDRPPSSYETEYYGGSSADVWPDQYPERDYPVPGEREWEDQEEDDL